MGVTVERARRAGALLGVVLLLASACGGGGSGSGGLAPPPVDPGAPPPVPPPALVPPTLEGAPEIEPGPIAMRRLTERQHEASIADVLGPDVVIAGRIEPDNRRSGLLAVGSSYVSVTSSGFEQYDSIARSVARQALDVAHRSALVPCEPRVASGPDDACAAEFVRALGRRLLRRPLEDADVQPRVEQASAAARQLSDFYGGLEVALASMLISPEFLFRVEIAEPDPDDARRQRLTSLSMASRLSYLLWNTTPDDELLAAAERGDLVDAAGLEAQVERLLDSPRVEESVRQIFSDIYGFDQIEQGLVRKDPALFPAFSSKLIEDAEEQTLRVIVEHLLTEDGDYRELFTTRKSFMTRALGVVYRVPVPQAEGWQPFEFPAGGDRAGLLTHVSLLALYSHPGRSSPTLRGKFVREVLLCQDVPPPPGNIDFSMFDDMSGANRRTARERLTAHVANPACAGCHQLMDPIGLGLEKMDGIGAFRETEGGETIDPSGDLNGVAFDDAVGLGEALSKDPLLGPCFVSTVFKYATGRDPMPGERSFLAFLDGKLTASGYRLRDLLRLIATSEAFRTTSGPREVEAEEQP